MDEDITGEEFTLQDAFLTQLDFGNLFFGDNHLIDCFLKVMSLNPRLQVIPSLLFGA